MKNAVIIAIIIMLSLSTLPLCALKDSGFDKAVSAAVTKTVKAEKKQKTDEKVFRIKIKNSGEIKKISATDYIIGVLAGEMSPLNETEALKAQAVAAYSFALYRKGKAGSRDYDLTDTPDTDQCFIETEKLKEKWGENYDKYYETLKNVVNSVKGEYLSFGGKPALAVYHAISSGKTENASDIWGGDYPYLKSVESIGDKLSPNFLSEASFSKEELYEKLKDLNQSGEGEAFSKEERTKAGAVKSIEYFGKKVKGSQIQAALSLKSSNFSVEFKDDVYYFSVKGYGHGVGMSQTGAQYLAKQGSTYKEILFHYYGGCELK